MHHECVAVLIMEMLRYHSENKGLGCAHEGLIKDMKLLHALYGSAEAFLSTLIDIRLGAPRLSACFQCLTTDSSQEAPDGEEHPMLSDTR